MAGEFHTAGGDDALDAVTGRTGGVNPFTSYLMLILDSYTITDSSTFANLVTNEVTVAGTNGYARQSVTWAAPADNAGVRKTSNSNLLTFGAFTADLGSVGKCALVDASTGSTGTVRAFWTLDTARDPANGDSIEFAIGALVLNVD